MTHKTNFVRRRILKSLYLGIVYVIWDFISPFLFFNGRGGIVVRAHAFREEGLWFESHSMPILNAGSLFTQQWVSGGNTGEIKAARKGTGHPTSYADV